MTLESWMRRDLTTNVSKSVGSGYLKNGTDSPRVEVSIAWTDRSEQKFRFVTSWLRRYAIEDAYSNGHASVPVKDRCPGPSLIKQLTKAIAEVCWDLCRVLLPQYRYLCSQCQLLFGILKNSQSLPRSTRCPVLASMWYVEGINPLD